MDAINTVNIKKYITEDRLLQYYNDINDTNFDNLYDAWSYNFFNRCWTLEYSKDWSQIDYNNGDTIVEKWRINGELTDNAYQNVAWSWADSINISKIKEEAPAEDADDPAEPEIIPIEPDVPDNQDALKDPDTPEDIAENVDTTEQEEVTVSDTDKEESVEKSVTTHTPKTSDTTDILLYMLLAMFAAFAAFGIHRYLRNSI